MLVRLTALRDLDLARRIVWAGIENRSYRLEEDATMPLKQASKRKRVTKAAVPALGAAGLTFSLAGGASASTLPSADAAQKLNFSPTQGVLLGEEEIADVSLSTFHLFDKENSTAGAQQMAWGCRCGGCRGCGGWRGCRCGGGGGVGGGEFGGAGLAARQWVFPACAKGAALSGCPTKDDVFMGGARSSPRPIFCARLIPSPEDPPVTRRFPITSRDANALVAPA